MKKKYNVVLEMNNGTTYFDTVAENAMNDVISVFQKTAEATSVKIYQCVDGGRGKGYYGLVYEDAKKMKMGFLK